MKYNLSSFCLFFCLVFAAGCGNRQAVFQPRQFPSLKIPSVIASGDNGSVLEYVSYYFWDSFADTTEFYRSDSSFVNGVSKREVEQNFSIWITSLESLELNAAYKAIIRMSERIISVERKDSTSNVFDFLGEMMEKYLYDPNSPVRNEDLYGKFASFMMDCSLMGQDQRERYKYDYQMCSLNKTGSVAADFVFSDSKGRQYSLYGIKAEYTLLFFTNPGCNACRQIISVLESNEKFCSLVNSHRLAVINIYIDDDLEQWYSHLEEYPENWYNGYDPNYVIRTDVLYNVRAIPSLYLLDSSKRVILKDAPENKVLSLIEDLI